MKKILISLLAAVFIISLTTGCSSEKKDSSTTSQLEANSQTTDNKPSIDKEKLDATMAVLDSIMESSFGSDYSIVYDEGGVIISISKEGAAQAKSGNSVAVKEWGELVTSLQKLTTSLQEILEKSDLSGIPVTVQCFDTQDNNTAIAIAVDGEVTYDASK